MWLDLFPGWDPSIRVTPSSTSQSDSHRFRAAVTRNSEPATVLVLAGDQRAGATPVPIPNTAVKPGSVDGTSDDRRWESRPPPAIPLRKPVAEHRDGLSVSRSRTAKGAVVTRREPPQGRSDASTCNWSGVFAPATGNHWQLAVWQLPCSLQTPFLATILNDEARPRGPGSPRSPGQTPRPVPRRHPGPVRRRARATSGPGPGQHRHLPVREPLARQHRRLSRRGAAGGDLRPPRPRAGPRRQERHGRARAVAPHAGPHGRRPRAARPVVRHRHAAARRPRPRGQRRAGARHERRRRLGRAVPTRRRRAGRGRGTDRRVRGRRRRGPPRAGPALRPPPARHDEPRSLPPSGFTASRPRPTRAES